MRARRERVHGETQLLSRPGKPQDLLPLGAGGVLCGHNQGAAAKCCEIRYQSHEAKFSTGGFKKWKE